MLRKFYAPELMNRFFDVIQIQKGLAKILIDLSSSSLQIIFGLLLLSFYHPMFIFLGLILVVVLVLIFRILGPRGLSASLKESKYKYEVVLWLEELARVNDTFKLAGNTDLPLNRTDEYVNNYLKARKAHFKILVWQYAAIIFFKTVIIASLLIAGSILVVNNELNLGQFIAAEILIIMVMQSAEKVVLSLEAVYDVVTAVEKVGSVMDLDLERSSGQKLMQEPETGMKLELRELSVFNPERNKYSLHNISLTIQPSEKICITGANHSGKSTLLQAIAGLYCDYEGSIIYNDTPLSQLNIPSLRDHIGDNLSLEDLFYGSVYDNITLGKSDCDPHRLNAIIEKTGLREFIMESPDGLDRKILPGGKNLPKSIVRKIMLARSLAMKKELLIIEDLMLHLNKAERENMMELFLGKDNKGTVIITSNDPSIAALCDRVIVLEKGEVAAQDTYQNLKSRTDLFE
jgi:ABC-type bacteriocin/lantibiotic exporter with double-glycine peptidase domain